MGARRRVSALPGGAAAPPDGLAEHAVCLGCGCACDDVGVRVERGRIVEARRACPLGVAWFGDGTVPARVRVGGQDAALGAALDAAARLLAGASSPLVYLAPDVSTDTQRAAVAAADLLRGAADSVTSATAMPFILAAQERGRAGATWGEVRNRGDVLVFWGVDPAERYPRYRERYAPPSAGTHLAAGAAARTVVAVDVGAARGPADARLRVAVRAEDEVAVLTALAALARQPAGGAAPGVPERGGAAWAAAGELAPVLAAARYVVLVHDAEPAPGRDGDDAPPERARRAAREGALVALGHALNGVTRCALSTLRGGGNRSGADAVLTAQTGYPAAVDFARGFPRYAPHDGAAGARAARGEVDALLLVGSAALVPPSVARALAGVPAAVIGPRATEGAFAAAAVAIDSGVAGIHEGGTALRADDVPLPLRALVAGPPAARDLMRALVERLAPLTASRRVVGQGRAAAGGTA